MEEEIDTILNQEEEFEVAEAAYNLLIARNTLARIRNHPNLAL